MRLMETTTRMTLSAFEERGRTIDSLRDLESEKVIKADGYSSGWSLRDLDDDESWRRDHSGPCSLLWVLAIRARSPG